jgi:hypothetical protein
MTAALSSDSVRKTAVRLLGSSSKNSYDPELDIDWDAPLDMSKAFMPLERVSLYGTPMWERMTEAQRIELSRQEIASVAGTGLWFEVLLIKMLARWVYHQDAQDPRAQYALTEIGDETRHIVMFAKAITRMGVPTYRPKRLINFLARPYASLARGATIFAPVLVAEEITDRLQRSMINDENINQLIRMVNRIHVVEEARHVRFAKEEVARQMAGAGRVEKVLVSLISAVVSAFVAASLISPDVYAAVGLDPKEAVKAARNNPNYAETRRWMGEKIMAFLEDQGMVTWYSKPIYELVSLI